MGNHETAFCCQSSILCCVVLKFHLSHPSNHAPICSTGTRWNTIYTPLRKYVCIYTIFFIISTSISENMINKRFRNGGSQSAVGQKVAFMISAKQLVMKMLRWLPVVTRRAVNVSAYKYETKNLVAVNLCIHKFYCQGFWSEK